MTTRLIKKKFYNLIGHYRGQIVEDDFCLSSVSNQVCATGPVELALVSDVAVLLTLVPARVDTEDHGVGISLPPNMQQR